MILIKISDSRSERKLAFLPFLLLALLTYGFGFALAQGHPSGIAFRAVKPDIFKNEGYQFMNAAFEVYNERGFGLAEEIYQESLEIELSLRQMVYRSKPELKCYYKGHELRKRYIPDLFVMECLVVELKAVTELTSEHEAQLFNYLRLAHQPVGYLVNFGHRGKLEWKRFILSELMPSDRRDTLISAEIG